MLIKQISIFVENKPGRLSEVTSVLAKNNINIRALSIADTTDFGILRIIVNNPTQALSVLKEAGFTVSVTNVIAATLKDEPGALANILTILTDADIAVEYTYAFIGNVSSEAYVIIRIEENEKAIEALTAKGVVLLTEDKVYTM